MSSWKELKDNPRLKEIYIKRLEIIRLIREFFWSKEFIEVETPIALKFPGQELYLNPPELIFHNPKGEFEKFFLHTSPEYGMKKLLAAGFNKVFQITKCFRDYEAWGDGTHNTEFAMIEWYRAPGTYFEFMNDAEELFKYVARQYQVSSIKYQGKEIDVLDSWDRKSMKELWKEYVGVNLDDYLEIKELQKLTEKRRFAISDNDQYEDLFFKIFLNEIEPHLGAKRPVFVYEYPAQMCSLSRRCAYDKRYAERAELYIGGLELANGFGELTDGEEQEKRLEEDRNMRKKLGKPTWEVDQDFIAALASGIPESSGIALGIDRMVMLFTGARSINEVLFQSVNDQLNSIR